MQDLKEYIISHKNEIIIRKTLLGDIEFNIIKLFLENASAKLYKEFKEAIYQIYPEKEVIKQPSEKKIIIKIIDWCNNNLNINQNKIILM